MVTVTKHPAPPQTLAEFLSSIALRSDVAILQLRGMAEQVRGQLEKAPWFNGVTYKADPEKMDEMLVPVERLHALLLALKQLYQGVKPEDIVFVSSTPAGSAERSDSRVTAAKPKANFPGSKFGLTAELAALPLAKVLDDGTRLSHVAISTLAKNHMVTLGQLVARWQFRDRRLMTLKKPGIGPTIIEKVIRPCVAKALSVEAAKLGKAAPQKAKRGAKAAKAVTRVITMEEPWLAFGLTKAQWDTRLRDLFTEDSFEARKMRKLVGRRRRLTVGDILGPTKGKMARIRKTFFGKGFGPKTQRYLKAKLAALKVPQEMLVVTMAAPAPSSAPV